MVYYRYIRTWHIRAAVGGIRTPCTTTVRFFRRKITFTGRRAFRRRVFPQIVLLRRLPYLHNAYVRARDELTYASYHYVRRRRVLSGRRDRVLVTRKRYNRRHNNNNHTDDGSVPSGDRYAENVRYTI